MGREITIPLPEIWAGHAPRQAPALGRRPPRGAHQRQKNRSRIRMPINAAAGKAERIRMPGTDTACSAIAEETAIRSST